MNVRQGSGEGPASPKKLAGDLMQDRAKNHLNGVYRV
jgi:hypothetical protein